jgi:hypothetical protein
MSSSLENDLGPTGVGVADGVLPFLILVVNLAHFNDLHNSLNTLISTPNSFDMLDWKFRSSSLSSKGIVSCRASMPRTLTSFKTKVPNFMALLFSYLFSMFS